MAPSPEDLRPGIGNDVDRSCFNELGLDWIAMQQIATDVVFAAVMGCTAFNVYSVVSVRAGSRVTRVDVRAAAWCAVAALVGFGLLLFALAG